MRALVLAAACLAIALSGTGYGQVEPVRAVYHFGDGLEQASRGLEYMRNHLEANPKSQIVAVAHAAGVDFLMRGTKTAKGNEYRGMIEDLQLQGVQFQVCEITLRERGLRREQFLPDVRFVPSGVAEIARLQAQERHAYVRP